MQILGTKTIIECGHCKKKIVSIRPNQEYCGDKPCQRARKRNARAKRAKLEVEQVYCVPVADISFNSNEVLSLKKENEVLKQELKEVNSKLRTCFDRYVELHGAYKYAVETGDV